jgi:hypothetical protein
MKRGRRLFIWFLFSGCVGLFVALTLAYVPWPAILVNDSVRLALWPTIIFGMADPAETWLKIVLAILLYGGNFVWYGSLLGTLVGLCFHRVSNSKRSNSSLHKYFRSFE